MKAIKIHFFLNFNFPILENTLNNILFTNSLRLLINVSKILLTKLIESYIIAFL